MPNAYSAAFNQTLRATSPADQPVFLLEISHEFMPIPARVVNDTQTLIGPGGETFIAAAFRFTLPDQTDKQLSSARLEVDNVSRELMSWIEASQGGRGASVRIMIVRVGAPTVIEDEYTFSLRSLSVTSKVISVELGYENLLDVPAVAIRHDPRHTPSIY